LRLLTDTYGLDARDDFLGLVAAAAGEPAFQRMVADGHSDRMRDDRAFLAANAFAWRTALGR
jgi:hypothetical protein